MDKMPVKRVIMTAEELKKAFPDPREKTAWDGNIHYERCEWGEAYRQMIETRQKEPGDANT